MTDKNFLDATGLLCPLPVLKARKRLQSLASGDLLTVHADDPAAIIDIPHFCRSEGHELVASAPSQAGGHSFTIRRGETASAD